MFGKIRTEMAISPVKFKIKGQDFLKNLPEEPGVYMMKDAGGEILYVGKAKNLKSRVGSYFQSEKPGRLSPRIELLVRRVEDLDIVLTDNEVEALILEFNLIKKYKPKFNVSLRDDKSYPYVRLDLNHPFPRLEYVRRVQKDGARYFGPFVSAYEIKDTLRWAQKTFRLRDCSDNEFRNRARPCILHQMGQCSAPCVGLITEKDYDKSIKQVLKILDGKYEEVIKVLRKDMEAAAEAENFERAGELRDRMKMIEVVNQDQKISDPESDASRDIVHYRRNADVGRAVAVVLAIRDGRTVGVFQFPFENVDPSLTDAEFLFEFLAQYYLDRLENANQLLPDEVILPDAVKDMKDSLKTLHAALGRNTVFYL
jgi:excinuclease ABC subunit C